MAKRSSDDAVYPTPKQPRLGNDTPATSSSLRPHGRVMLDVGGTRFVSSKTTLEGSSSYFSALLTRWDEDTTEPLFIDGDADAFSELLSFMRSGALMLPQGDVRLCARVLLQAESLGMDALLDEVKAQTYANLHPGTHQDETRPLARAFDEEFDSLAAAIRSKVLPDRYFAPAPAPPPEPKRTIKALLPAAPGYRALFTRGVFDYGEARNVHVSQRFAESESLHIVSWALVEDRDGQQRVDAVVQRDLETTKAQTAMKRARANDTSHSHLQLASEYIGRNEEFNNEDRHWVVLPPRAPGQILPIPPGSVRGVWAQPALTDADEGKTITIEGSMMTVDGDVRKVEWDGDAPTNVVNGEIAQVVPWDDYDSAVQLDCGTTFELPRLASGSMKVDLAFASVESDGGSDLKTSFYMPLHTKGVHEVPATTLSDAINVSFGKLKFSHFIGATRS